jgi:hypothetical protein
VAQHVLDAFKYARKKYLNSNDILRMFPIPRNSEVDSDDWIDVNSVDDLEEKMKDITKFSDWKATSTKNENESKLRAMDTLAQGVQTFIEGSSDLLKGISSVEKQMEKDDLVLNSQVYMKILHRVLREDSANLRLDDISPDIENQEHESTDLLNFFSNEDFDWDDDEGMHGIDENMEGIMVSTYLPSNQRLHLKNGLRLTLRCTITIQREMDEQLSAKDPERLLKIFDGENERSGIELPYDDPAAIRANVISNLLESLEAQGGNSGPVTTIFSEESTTKRNNE